MQYIDSHTEGEPTRMLWSGGPDLGAGPLTERLRLMRDRFDMVRRMAVNEPRGYDALVGALIVEPVDRTCAAGVLFFNNTGYLRMCGHGAMGVAVSLAHLGRIEVGPCRLETPAGVVSVDLAADNCVSVQNVPSFRYRRNVEVEVVGYGRSCGDVAWGGNWFFLPYESPVPVERSHLRQLTDYACRLKRALGEQGVTGPEGEEIDHIEICSPAASTGADSRNFVLCPGGAYDRSPCGTGTSAKLACLAADGKVAPGEPFVQESIIGSRFTASYQAGEGNTIVPTITGHAHVTAEGRLIQHALDPFRHGIASESTA